MTNTAKKIPFTAEQLEFLASFIEFAKQARLGEVANLPSTEVASELEDANAIFHERPAPITPAAIPPAPTFPNVPTPRPRVKQGWTRWPNNQLDVLYDYAIEKGFPWALYQFEPDRKKGKGHNAAYLVNGQNIGVDGTSYQHLVDSGDCYRDTPISDLKANHWAAKNSHLHKLRSMMKAEGRWTFSPPAKKVPTKKAAAPAPVATPAPSVTPTSLERFENCDIKQQAFLEAIYALIPPSSWVKMSDIRGTLIKNPLYTKKTIKAFDAAIAAHLEKKGYVTRKGKNADLRMIKRVK